MTASSWSLPRERWAWVAMALGFCLLWFSSQSLYHGIVSTGWPTADATIIYSTSKDTTRRRYVDIRYIYHVHGSDYTGDEYRYSVFMNRWQMRSIEVSAAQAAYPVGSRVNVAFDPRKPDRSVLEPGPHFDDLLWMVGGLLFAGIGLSSGMTKSAPPSPSGKPRYHLAGALAGISLLLMGLGLYRIRADLAASAWPTVEGRVLYSKTGGGDSSGNYRTEVRYEYFLEERRHVGAASLFGRHDRSLSLSNSHPAGQTVAIHYDPANPAHSVIETGITWHHFMLPLYAVVVLLFAALAGAVAKARSKR
jgi:hypothetical protein